MLVLFFTPRAADWITILMKRQWDTDELIEQWTLLPAELVLLATKQDHNRLGFAVLLKFFQYEGRFPQQRHEIPGVVVAYLAKQVDVAPDLFFQYDWHGRTSSTDRSAIRAFLGFRESTSQDLQDLAAWLCEHVLAHDQHLDHLKAVVYERCRELRIEPPAPQPIERLIRSAIRSYEDQFYTSVLTQLTPTMRAELDALLSVPASLESISDSEAVDTSCVPWSELKADPGRASLASMLQEMAKLQRVRQVGLPADLFRHSAPKVLRLYRQRAASESLYELRRHSEAVRYTLLAIFCWLRSQELTDTLVDLLIRIIHRIGARAEEKVEREWLADWQRVEGKTTLLFRLAEAALNQPDGVIKEVLYPLVGEQTLHDLVKEWKASGPTYRQTVQRRMRASYSTHYRRMVPQLLALLDFRSNNEAHRPVIRALALLNAYAGRTERYFDANEEVPLDGVVRREWRTFVVKVDKEGRDRVNRITYEICVLEALREKLRCKEIWVVGAHRYRNPEEDLPSDFEAQREHYYQALRQPQDAATFITTLQAAMTNALQELDRGLPHNTAVKLLEKGGGWIALSPLEPQAAPVMLTRLKAEIVQRWPMTSLLDILKETDLQVDFTGLFKSVATREVLDRLTLQKRLLLCLYGLGTNAGLKRISSGEHGESYNHLLAVRRRFIQKEHLQNAIARVVNAIFQARLDHIWGEGTTACASDAKKFGAWDQN
ncbi:MAG: Tn3 family transposase, partial [Chloroflexota bacterium]|nr:Tn3 family transposase [Chloroflexota bacterium]